MSNKKIGYLSIAISIIFVILFYESIIRDGSKSGRSKHLDRLTILCAGDSLTAGSYPEWLKKKFIENGMEIKVVNKGVKGHTSGEYLRYMEVHQILNESDPDIILLQLGTNDVRIDADNTPTNQFNKNMNQIIKKMSQFQNSRGKLPKILISSVPPINTIYSTFNQESVRRIKEEINPAIERLAAKWNLFFVDNYKLFLDNPEILPDIHPNEKGYEAMAENYYRSLVSLP